MTNIKKDIIDKVIAQYQSAGWLAWHREEDHMIILDGCVEVPEEEAVIKMLDVLIQHRATEKRDQA